MLQNLLSGPQIGCPVRLNTNDAMLGLYCMLHAHPRV